MGQKGRRKSRLQRQPRQQQQDPAAEQLGQSTADVYQSLVTVSLACCSMARIPFKLLGTQDVSLPHRFLIEIPSSDIDMRSLVLPASNRLPRPQYGGTGAPAKRDDKFALEH